MLRPMLVRIEQAPDDESIGYPLLRKKGFAKCVQDLNAQVRCFWDNGYPFAVQPEDRQLISDPLEWWQGIAPFNNADVLEVCFYHLAIQSLFYI
jgi:hypothetical protein